MQTTMKVMLLSTMMTIVVLFILSNFGDKSNSTSLKLEKVAYGMDDRRSRKERRGPEFDPEYTQSERTSLPAQPRVPSSSSARDKTDSLQNTRSQASQTRATKVSEPPRPTEPFKGSYPEWFSTAWKASKSAKRNEIVDDKPLFDQCVSRYSSHDRYKYIDPKKYIQTSKNPCWYEDPKRKMGFRCIPYFYIAGVAKCGTTDLYRRLRYHPDIMKGTKKEYHFWDRERFGNVEISEDGEILDVARKPLTFKQYTDDITGPALKVVQKEIESDGGSIKLFGDGSPSYLWDLLNWQLLDGNQGCKEPRIVIGQHIRHIYPPSKMILIFRHPTPRLYSRFLSRIWRTSYLKGATSQTFHDYVVKGVQMYRECFKRWSIRTCAYNYTLFDNAVVRLVEGMYPIYMKDWFRIWPRENLLILRSEDYGANMTDILEKTFKFLNVAELTGATYDAVMNQRLVNVGAEYDKVGPMKPETVKILDQFYQPFVEQFAEILQDRRFLWRDTYTPNLS